MARSHRAFSSSTFQFRQPLTFSAYSKQEVLDILRQRVGTTLLHERALEMIALKCVGERGDARTALGVTADICKARLDALEDESILSQGPLVTIKDVIAFFQSQGRTMTDRIQGLPQACKFCLVVLSTLGKVRVTETNVAKLRSFVTKCTIYEDDLMTAEDFVGCLETLNDSGLLRIETTNLSSLPMVHQMNVRVQLGYQLEDVQIALDKVCKGGIYDEIRRWVPENLADLVVEG